MYILFFLVVPLLFFFWVVYHFMIRSTTTCSKSAPPTPPHAQPLNTQTNTATATNIHASMPRLKSREASSPATVHPPAMSKSQSNSEVDHVVPPWRRKLPTPQLTSPPPDPPHKNISCNNNNSSNSNSKSNSNNYPPRRKLDITAPRLHATTNPLTLTDGTQHMQRNPARFAKK